MKKNTMVLISGIIGTLYMIYIISYFFDAVTSSEGVEQIGAGLAAAIIAPHMFLLVLAVLFNWIGYLTNATWGALVSGILYSVSGFLFLPYVIFVIPPIVLSFIGYAKMKKAKLTEAS